MFNFMAFYILYWLINLEIDRYILFMYKFDPVRYQGLGPLTYVQIFPSALNRVVETNVLVLYQSLGAAPAMWVL